MHHIIILALAFYFAVEFIRALPWPKSLKHQKPLSCSTCMVGWCVAFTVTIQFLAQFFGHSMGTTLPTLAAAGLARVLFILRSHFEPEMPD